MTEIITDPQLRVVKAFNEHISIANLSLVFHIQIWAIKIFYLVKIYPSEILTTSTTRSLVRHFVHSSTEAVDVPFKLFYTILNNRE